MSRKTMLMIGMVLGSTVGSAIPMLWGSDLFSITSVALGFVGGIAGIWLVYSMTG